jgi:hypothetical protein
LDCSVARKKIPRDKTARFDLAAAAYCTQFMLALLFKAWDLAKPRAKSKAQITFCVAHFNAADFLEVTLHAIRRHHAEARIVVADSQSAGSQYLAARAACKKFSAELCPLLGRRGHTGTLNFLFRKIRTKTAVFLDQDCVLLEPLDPLLQKMAAGILLSGPRDEMQTTHPKHPAAWHKRFRKNPQFIHASLMVVNAGELRHWMGSQPFHWDSAWGPQPLERYYGFTERIRRQSPDAIFSLDSRHTGYGLGMVYLHDGRPIAYHNWYSGRIFGHSGKMDGGVEADWLRSEMSRFIRDYWAGTLELDLQ